MKNILLHIADQLTISLQKEIEIKYAQEVPGGDINETYILQTNAGKFFCKINDTSKQDMFAKEFHGLQLLQSTSTITIPSPLLYGEYADSIFLVMEFIEKGNIGPGFWKEFGYSLAALHKNSQLYFGLDKHNYIGSIRQQNNYCKSWSEFYISQRIEPLLLKAVEQNKCTMADIKNAEQLYKKLDVIFPEEPAALLHGDLWNGNFMVMQNGKATIYDPAVYYGHREMDIAMTLLFGGFDTSFYDYYNEAFTLEKNWRQRVELCQLYPLLVHLLLFGGHYYYQVKNILQKYS